MSVNTNSVDYRVKSVLRDTLGSTAPEMEEFKPETTFQELGYDSLDAVEAVMMLEEEFDIVIPDEEVDKIDTVGQMVDYITKSLNK